MPYRAGLCRVSRLAQLRPVLSTHVGTTSCLPAPFTLLRVRAHLQDDGIQFCVSSRRRQTQRFLDTLTDVLLDMAVVLDSKLQASAGVQLGADVGMPLSTPVMRSNSGGRSSFVSGRDTRSGSARNAWGPHSHGTAGSGARWEAAHHQDVHEGHSNGGSSGSGGRGFGFRQGGGTSGSMGRGRMDSSM